MKGENNDNKTKAHTIHQQESRVDWVVRHCSPHIVVHDITDVNRAGDQPDPLGFSDWCAPVDWRSVRLKDSD